MCRMKLVLSILCLICLIVYPSMSYATIRQSAERLRPYLRNRADAAVFLLHAILLDSDFTPCVVVEGQTHPAEALPRGWNCGDGVYTLHYRRVPPELPATSSQNGSQGEVDNKTTPKSLDIRTLSVKAVHLGDVLFIHVIGADASGKETAPLSRDIQLSAYFPPSDKFQKDLAAVSISESASPRHESSWEYVRDLPLFNEIVDNLRTRIVHPLFHPRNVVSGADASSSTSTSTGSSQSLGEISENKTATVRSTSKERKDGDQGDGQRDEDEEDKDDKDKSEDVQAQMQSQLQHEMTAAEAAEIAKDAQAEREGYAQARVQVQLPARAPPPYEPGSSRSPPGSGNHPLRGGGRGGDDDDMSGHGERPVFGMPGGRMRQPGSDLDPLGVEGGGGDLRNTLGRGSHGHGEDNLFEGGNLVGPGQLDRLARGGGHAGRGGRGGMAPRFDPYGPFPGMGKPNSDHMRKPGPRGFGPGGFM